MSHRNACRISMVGRILLVTYFRVFLTTKLTILQHVLQQIPPEEAIRNGDSSFLAAALTASVQTS